MSSNLWFPVTHGQLCWWKECCSAIWTVEAKHLMKDSKEHLDMRASKIPHHHPVDEKKWTIMKWTFWFQWLQEIFVISFELIHYVDAWVDLVQHWQVLTSLKQYERKEVNQILWSSLMMSGAGRNFEIDQGRHTARQRNSLGAFGTPAQLWSGRTFVVSVCNPAECSCQFFLALFGLKQFLHFSQLIWGQRQDWLHFWSKNSAFLSQEWGKRKMKRSPMAPWSTNIKLKGLAKMTGWTMIL